MAPATDSAIANERLAGGLLVPNRGTYSLQIGISCLLLIVSAFAWWGSSIPLLVGATLIGCTANLALVALELPNIVSRKGKLAPLLIIGGTLFWFLIDATELALNEVPFSSRYTLYPYFSSGIPLDVVGKTLFGIFLFQVFALLGVRYIWIPNAVISKLCKRKDRFTGFQMDVACLLVSLLLFVPIVISVGGDPVQALHRMAEMRNSEAEQVFATEDPGLWIHLLLLGVFGGSVSTARFLLGARGSAPIRIIAMLLSSMWVFLSGTRFLMIFLILPSIVLLTSPISGRARATQMKMKLIAIAAIAGTAIFAQAAIRDMGVEGYSNYEHASDVIRGGAVGYEHFEAMAIAIDLADRTDTFFHEFLLPVIVRHFIPRVWWPEKPDWESWAFYNDAVTGSASFNVTPSITGEYYLNWGLWGIAYIGLFFGWLARCSDEWLQRCSLADGFSSAVFCGFFYGFLFVSFRILSPIYIAYVIGAAIVFVVLTRPGERPRPIVAR